MAVELGNAFHYFIPLVLCVAGFHGTLFYASAWGKTVAWCAFQAGLAVFLFQLTAPENPFPSALAFLLLVVTAETAILLAAYCVKNGGRLKAPEGGKNARRRSR